MDMHRKIYQQLLDWQKSKRRKPLIVQGARQVGKTYILKTFAKNEYQDYVYLNFDEDARLGEFFKSNLEPNEILLKLEIYCDKKIEAEKTLIIFDEIQESAEALNSLKYFYENENTNKHHIISAGSLLGIKLANNKGFPVGKVNFLDMYPMTFFEFLAAIGKDKLKKYLQEINKIEPIVKPFHEELIEILKEYFIVGGMPEAVAEYSQSKDFTVVREVQKEVLRAYELDFAKHAESSQIMKISNIWNLLPSELAKENKKFFINSINKSARFREYETALQWLNDARLIHKSYKISNPKLPLSSYAEENFFKIYMLDIGLLAAMSKIPENLILEKNKLFVEYKGAFTENFVAQEIAAHHDQDLYYWTSSASAEIDFILSRKNEIFPLEVKAGGSKHKKSLRSYANRYQAPKLLRTTLMNLKQDDDVLNCPLYLVNRISDFI